MARHNYERTESQSNGNSDPNIVQDQYKWTIHNATVNLPALLNDPRLVKRETDFFTKTWGQSFERVEILPSPYVPEIGPEHFEKYIRKTSVVSITFTVTLLLFIIHYAFNLVAKHFSMPETTV